MRADRGRAASTARATLIAAALGTALAYMSDDMLNLAIPSVARDLGASITDVQWILNAYYVSLVSCVLAIGSIGDIAGHRRVFLAGIGLFSAGAVICAAAPGVWVLVLGRAVQGVAAAMLLTAGLALVARLGEAAGRSGSVGAYFGLVAAVPAVGPFLSGTLVDLLSWRALFLLPLVLPLLAFVVARRFVSETPAAADRRVDAAGAGLAFATLAALSVALILGADSGAGTLPIAAALFAIGAGVAFVAVESHASDPMLPLRFFRNRAFLGGNLLWLLACLTTWGAIFFVAVTLQVTLGLRPIVAGLVLTPIYLVMLSVSPLAGRFADRHGPHGPILVGLTVYAGGLSVLSGIGPGSAVVPGVVAGILVMAIGMALVTAPLASVTLGALDASDQGVASGLNNAMGQLAGLLGVVILPAIAGLGGAGFADPEFALGHGRALRAMTLIAVACIPLAAWTLAARPVGRMAQDSIVNTPGKY